MPGSQRITYVSVTPVPSYYLKELGKNAYADNVGRQRLEWVVRARTNEGVEGYTIANRFMRQPGSSVAKLLEFLKATLQGTEVDDLLDVSDRRVVGGGAVKRAYEDNGWLSILSFDLYGKAHRVSAIDLLGGRVRDSIPAYDTTLYFQDFLVPEKGASQVAEEAASAVRAGWRALKIKTGRGGRWMLPEDGMRRDVAVVNGVREAVGPDVKIMVDGNFGYDGRLDLLEAFIRDTSDSNVFWLEEMVTHDVDDYRRLREMQVKYAPQALVTCGEVDRTPISQTFRHLIEDGLIDGYQPDVVSAGYLTWLDIQSQLEGTDVRCIPHDFGNGTFGAYAGAVFGAACPTFVSLEDERCPKSVFTPQWEFKNGEYIVPDAPGLGIEIDPNAWKDHEKHEWAVE